MINSQLWEFGGEDFHEKLTEKVWRLSSWSEEWKGLFGWIIRITMDSNELRGEW